MAYEIPEVNKAVLRGFKEGGALALTQLVKQARRGVEGEVDDEYFVRELDKALPVFGHDGVLVTSVAAARPQPYGTPKELDVELSLASPGQRRPESRVVINADNTDHPLWWPFIEDGSRTNGDMFRVSAFVAQALRTAGALEPAAADQLEHDLNGLAEAVRGLSGAAGEGLSVIDLLFGRPLPGANPQA